MSSRYRIGFDIGGTFTDFILLDAAALGDPAAQMPDHAGTTPRSARWRGWTSS